MSTVERIQEPWATCGGVGGARFETAFVIPERHTMPARIQRGVLTTGQIAKICLVAPRTVGKWIDQGLLSGWKIPGSRDRRVDASAFEEFLRSNNMAAAAGRLREFRSGHVEESG